MQWATQGITLNVPEPSPKNDSIGTMNTTALGYPEISYYASTMWPEYNVSYSIHWAKRVLNYYKTSNPKVFIRNSDALLNVGNLNFLYENGANYDSTLNISYLNNIQHRFRLNTTNQTFVFWEYMKYFVHEFGEDQLQGGDKQTLTLGAFSSQGLYVSFINMSDWLLNNITSMMML